MGKYDENISDNSQWITATPTPLAKTLPFYASEAGHFIADYDYKVQRETHDSFLLIYTISGQGSVQTADNSILLNSGYSVIIDCHIPHEYHTASDKWEFFWIHLSGSGISPLFDIIYPDGIARAINMLNVHEFENTLSTLINSITKNDVAGCIGISSDMHSILNFICLSSLENEKVGMKKEYADDIQTVIKFIENNYSEPISIDDMIENIHVSKYHFIRRFSRAMGITPYSYLTNYRINMSKTLLRSTDKTVSEIAECCGFLDTSNFINHFKKHTGQKPLQYRRDFS